jgi:polyphosphate kinase
MLFEERINTQINSSRLVSRDLSWVQFNHRVLDQAKSTKRNIFEKMKFLAICASNMDEFFMVRVGSLYNYLDYGKQRIDYSGMREDVFKQKLYQELQEFTKEQYRYLKKSILPSTQKNLFSIGRLDDLTSDESKKVSSYFKKTVFPLLTPMLADAYRTFPLLMNKLLIFGVVTMEEGMSGKEQRQITFVQVPTNLPRFFEIERDDEVVFIPIEEIIRANMKRLFRNVEIHSANLFRITRNGDYTLEESEDLESGFIEELKRKLKSRRTGRVVRLEIEPSCSKWILKRFKEIWKIDDDNIFYANSLIDLTGLWQIIKHDAFKYEMPRPPAPIVPLSMQEVAGENIFQQIRKQDILLHHPYNSIDPLMELLETAADDPSVLGIKMTIYRLAKDSRVTAALINAAENGKHVSALFEVKARFDEENNLKEARKLQDLGCFVIHGVSALKTHTKLLLIIRKEGEKIVRYVHMGSGNYNEDTAGLYTDLGLLTAKEEYAHDVSELFNAITGHSKPRSYEHLLTAPLNMREQLIELIDQESANSREGKHAGIMIKINSLQDDKLIGALYRASNAGVKVKLVVRGICCLRPGRKELSENIEVRSIVGDFLEHSRIFYFHNEGDPKVYSGSADVMVRSFDRRVESLFEFIDEKLRNEAVNLLKFNWMDNTNAYIMKEDASFEKLTANGKPVFNVHQAFYDLTPEDVEGVELF